MALRVWWWMCRWFMTVLGIVVIPFLVYWCWICVEYNKGSMILPYYTSIKLASDKLHNFSHPLTSSSTTFTLSTWWDYISSKIINHAIPTRQAWTIYLVWTVFQAVLFKGNTQCSLSL